jgi:hypothetical protein
MEWWLTVFFLIGTNWVPGDRVDGWASRPYATLEVCNLRRQFAEREVRHNPLEFKSVWICNAGGPATAPPPQEFYVRRPGRHGATAEAGTNASP